MENNNQIQMSAISQIQAQMKNHWKEDLHNRRPRISGNEEVEVVLLPECHQEETISVGWNPNMLIKDQKMHHVCQHAAQRMATQKQWPFSGRLAQMPGHNSHQGPQNWHNCLNDNAIS
jgi:hypothetical protein